MFIYTMEYCCVLLLKSKFLFFSIRIQRNLYHSNLFIYRKIYPLNNIPCLRTIRNTITYLSATCLMHIQNFLFITLNNAFDYITKSIQQQLIGIQLLQHSFYVKEINIWSKLLPNAMCDILETTNMN